jgi:nitronate monooxygenase
MIGVGSAGSTKMLETEVRHPREAGVGFGIGLIDWAVQRDPALLEAAIRARPMLVAVSFGDDWSWAEAVRAVGIVATTQIYDVDQTRRAVGAGIQVLVARGAEGGGHGQPTIGTLALLESVLEAVDVPVLAAGGIATGRGVAAVLAAGASGVWLGTAFAACRESLISDPASSWHCCVPQGRRRWSPARSTSHSATHGRPSTLNESCGTTLLTDGRDTKHSWPSTVTRQPL